MEFHGYNGNILKYDGNTITVPINNNVSSWTFNLSKNNNEEDRKIALQVVLNELIKKFFQY